MRYTVDLYYTRSWNYSYDDVERGFDDQALAGLKARGHYIVEPMGQTSANSIAINESGLLGAPDPRTRGAEAAGQ